MEKSYKMQQIYYPFIIGLSLENRLAAFKEYAKLGLAICVRSLLFFNFLVAGKFKHVEKNVRHLLSKKSTSELVLVEFIRPWSIGDQLAIKPQLHRDSSNLNQNSHSNFV